jgi:hypothetical protein
MLELRHLHKTWEPLESAKKANKSGSRPKTYRLSSKVSFGAGCRVPGAGTADKKRATQ